MKLQESVTVRLEQEIAEIIKNMAEEDDRSISYVIRKLIIEALTARKLMK